MEGSRDITHIGAIRFKTYSPDRICPQKTHDLVLLPVMFTLDEHDIAVCDKKL